ncbi:MAG TPA: phosphate ABC transporter permease PstA [Thermoleophilaceae bacterium]|jgi:phosphate transport system permease protein
MSDMAFDPTSPLTASGNLRRRQLVNRLAESAATAAALLAIAVLGIVIYAVIARGAGALNWDFFTKSPPAVVGAGGSAGGIAPAIVGTAIIVGFATAIAMPVGILVALYLTEFAKGRVGSAIKLTLDVLNGMPSIVIGVFVFGLLVSGHRQSGFAGSVALAIIMLPLIARSTQEVLLLVPKSLREAADALGVSRWRSVIGVVLPTAMGGILTGTVLAVARAAGETAPLLLCCSIFGNNTTVNLFGQAVPNIPVYIFTLSEQADPSGFTRAWGAALVLMAFILVSSLGARALLARSRRKLTQ